MSADGARRENEGRTLAAASMIPVWGQRADVEKHWLGLPCRSNYRFQTSARR